MYAGDPAVAVLGDQSGVAEEPQMPRDAGLGDGDDPGQLADVEPIVTEDTEQAEASRLRQQSEQ